ncbi:hypothetical protein QNH20_18880 [Neobacillus sp. WH10]|uniref:hypothetical protein n=1 Tax=Neobacillus sp. WH10 TaxID=3047873 RepID=UPI0024C1BDE2|nr:hypothetical protein [Neobacillus sp. WH10]WHY76174.1 hypothetical protein QNH20_18880 [Neobacillus sp. WH10]
METILFMIIVAIISTIFGKAKRNSGQSAKKPFSANGMEEIRTLFKELTNNEPAESTPIKTEQKAVMAQNNNRNLEKENIQVRQESEASRMVMAASRLQREKLKEQTTIARQEESETIISKDPDPKNLINGIVWSEILGEPRSKKPYFAKRR